MSKSSHEGKDKRGRSPVEVLISDDHLDLESDTVNPLGAIGSRLVKGAAAVRAALRRGEEDPPPEPPDTSSSN